ncbi:hypothetical protein NMG60_11035561 [Bertholletia excelsa]
MSSPGPPLPTYALLSDNNGNLRPPPYRQNVPRYDHQKRGGRRGKCCLKCICYCYCWFFIILSIFVAISIYFFTFYSPRMPKYEVQEIETEAFDIQPDSSLRTELLVTTEAQNPNRAIGFNYGSANSITVSYKDATICKGSFRAFNQGKENTTIMQIPLKGNSPFSPALYGSLIQNKNSGRIPLMVEVKLPVSIVLLERLPLKEVVVRVNISMVVDSLSPHKKINILSKNTYMVGLHI